MHALALNGEHAGRVPELCKDQICRQSRSWRVVEYSTVMDKDRSKARLYPWLTSVPWEWHRWRQTAMQASNRDRIARDFAFTCKVREQPDEHDNSLCRFVLVSAGIACIFTAQSADHCLLAQLPHMQYDALRAPLGPLGRGEVQGIWAPQGSTVGQRPQSAPWGHGFPQGGSPGNWKAHCAKQQYVSVHVVENVMHSCLSTKLSCLSTKLPCLSKKLSCLSAKPSWIIQFTHEEFVDNPDSSACYGDDKSRTVASLKGGHRAPQCGDSCDDLSACMVIHMFNAWYNVHIMLPCVWHSFYRVLSACYQSTHMLMSTCAHS